jgi:hypothetical protein
VFSFKQIAKLKERKKGGKNERRKEERKEKDTATN